MSHKLFEKYQLYKVELYESQYDDFILALNADEYINVLGLYKSPIMTGLFVSATVRICIPTRGVYRNLDIRSREEIVIYLHEQYPMMAPSVIPVRDDFPYKYIPHLNSGISKTNMSELNLCLYRGNIDEWFYENGTESFCALVNEWFSDLVNGELIKKDGFECVRSNGYDGVITADFELLEKRIKDDEKNRGFCFLNLDVRAFGFNVYNSDYSMENEKYPCILIYDNELINGEYISEKFENAADLKIFHSYKRLSRAVSQFRSKFYIPNRNKVQNEIELPVLMAVKRPQQVIGSVGCFEFIAFMLKFNFNDNPYVDTCKISKMVTIQSLNKQMAERLSGTCFEKEPIAILGCGALGSKVSLKMAKMGYLNQKIYDGDIILPHNLVRHVIDNSFAVGLNKAKVQAGIIKNMFGFTVNVEGVDDDSFSICENIENSMIVDCTASNRNLYWSCITDAVKMPIVRSEIFMQGKLGATCVEGKYRAPDVFDLRIELWYQAMDNNVIFQWLQQDTNRGDEEFNIGFGCSSDTMVLDDATISNHASVVPHLINKYYSSESGIIALNYFDKDNLENNFVKIIEVKKFQKYTTSDGWNIHISKRVFEQINQYIYDDRENTGIWFGNIDNKLKRIVIVDTYIAEDNQRNCGSVTGGINGVEKKIKYVQKCTNSLIDYVGEWHTHPNGVAVPSDRDRKTFGSIDDAHKPFLMTIFANDSVGNWVLS